MPRPPSHLRTVSLLALAHVLATAVFTASALAGSNQDARLAIDVRGMVPGRSCAALQDDFPACASIQTSHPVTGEFTAVVVLYGYTAIRAASYALSWPADWDIYDFTSCADLTIGGEVTQNPMPVAAVWTSPAVSSGGTSGRPLGVLRGFANSPGLIRILDDSEGGRALELVDAAYLSDGIVEHFGGAVGQAAEGDPCAFDSTLTAAFDAVIASGPVPIDVAFIDRSTGAPTSWSWEFGDGETSTLRNPVHNYSSCGLYDVRLVVGDGSGTDDTLRTAFVIATDSLAAAMTASPATGCVPHAVQFTDVSTGHATSWLWEFGDGETSTARNPSHAYMTPGVRDVRLTVANGCSQSSRIYARAIDTRSKAAPEFSADQTFGCAPLPVQFSDRSSGLPTSWLWDFGDGTTSTDQSPIHVYTSSGDYTVSLTLHNGCGDTTLVKPAYVRVRGVLQVDFTASPRTGCPTLVVQFDGFVAGVETPTSWHWDFGDGASSTLEDPVHAYSAPGSYTVSLTASGMCAPGTMIKGGFIQVLPVPSIDFAASTTFGCTPLAIQFTAVTDSSVTAWSWDFGDGTTSTLRNPSHVYTQPGNYTVSLAGTGTCPGTPKVRENYIHAMGPPLDVRFASTPRQGCAPLSVRFSDQTGAGDAEYLWDFGDGSTSSDGAPTHVFVARQPYDVSLRLSNDCGTGWTTKRNFIIGNRAPIPTFTVSDKVICPGEPVYFGNLTGGEVTTWLWDFGDGYTSTLREPAHLFDAPGTYDISLSVVTPCGESQSVVRGLVVVRDWQDPACDPAATELSGPFAEIGEGAIVIRWAVSPAAGFSGYHVLRATGVDGPFARVNPQLIPDRSAHGERSLSYRDTDALPETAYYYRIEAVRPDGSSEFFAAAAPVVMPMPEGAVRVITLGEPRPTPATSRVELELLIPPGPRARILASVYDSHGRRVATLADREYSGGAQRLGWNGDDDHGAKLGAGVYFIRVESGGQAWTRKAVLLR